MKLSLLYDGSMGKKAKEEKNHIQNNNKKNYLQENITILIIKIKKEIENTHTHKTRKNNNKRSI